MCTSDNIWYMRGRSLRLYYLLTILLFLPGLQAQTSDTTTIQGHVTDSSHAPMSGVSVSVTNLLTGAERTAQTNETGYFAIPGLVAGTNYRIRAAKDGFDPFVVNSLSPAAGTAADLELELNVAGKRSQVTVTGVVGEVRTDAPQLGDRIVGQQLAETPMTDRRITFFPLLDSANKPAINQGDIFTNQFLSTTNGSGRRQASFSVDGANGNDSWGRQTLFSSVPLAAVQEVGILTNAFSAAYGGSTGSAVNIITRRGVNRLRGQFIEVWRPTATSAALSGFSSSNAASGNDYTSNSMGQARSRSEDQSETLKHAFLCCLRIHARRQGIADCFARGSGKLSWPLSWMAGFFPLGSPDQRPP